MSQASPDSKPKTRVETDSMGEIEVPADKYWGADAAIAPQLNIGYDVMPC